MISLQNLSSPAGYKEGVASQINGSAPGERELTIAWLPLVGEESEEILAQVVTDEEGKPEAEETASTGKVSAVLSNDENVAAATSPCVGDWSKL